MKKIILLIMICALLIPNSAFAAQTSSAETEETTAQTYLENQIAQLLRDLGAMPTLDNPRDNLTRGAFAAAVAHLGKLKISDAYTSTPFGDVGAEYAYFSELSAAKEMGLIRGDERGNFLPNDNIQLDDAVGILLRLLGYADAAESFGGTEAMAMKIGLTKNLPPRSGETVNGEMYLALMENALSIDVALWKSPGEYTVQSGYTLVEANLGLRRLYGQITACADTAVDGESALLDQSFILSAAEGEVWLYSTYTKEELFRMLGRHAEVYCREEGGQYHAVSVLLDEDDRILTLTAGEIMGDRTTARRVVYVLKDGNGKEKTAKIDPSAWMIYNRTAVSDYTDRDFRITDGTMRLMDTDQNGDYDLVFIDCYRYTYVSYVDTERQIIYDQYHKNTLDLHQNEVELTENGLPLGLDEVKASDLILSQTDLSGRITAVRRVSNRLVGAVERVSDTECVIDGKTVDFSGYYQTLKNSSEKPKNFLEIKPGGMVCLLLDDNDRVVIAIAMDDQDRMQYGYLIALAQGGGLSKTVSARMLTENGKVQELTFKPRTVIDGESVKEKEIITYFVQNLSAQRAHEITEVGKVVTYAADADGRIARMDTPYLHAAKENVGDSLSCDRPRESIAWSREGESFSGFARVDGSTKMFLVPSSMSGSNKDYEVIRSGSLTSGRAYETEIYNIANDGRAGAAVVYSNDNSGSFIDGWDPVYMIDSFLTALDEEGSTIQKIAAYSLNGLTELTVKDGVPVDGLKAGDLIRCGFSMDGRVDRIETVFTVPSKADRKPSMSHTSFSASYWFWFGEVQHVDGNIACVRLNESGTDVRYFDFAKPFSGRCHYLYDAKRETIQTFEMGELIGAEDSDEPTWVLMYAWKGQVVDVFAYQNIE